MTAARMFWQVTRWARAARFWLFLLLALAAWAGFGRGEAKAQSFPTNPARCANPEIAAGGEGNDSCPSRQAAYDGIRARRDYVLASTACQSNPTGNVVITHLAPTGTNGRYGRYSISHDGTGSVVCRQSLNNSSRSYYLEQECSAGFIWSESLKRCVTDDCESLNGADKGMPLDPVVKPFRERCVAGCQLAMQAGTGGCTVLGGVGGGEMHCTGVFQYTGEHCTADPTEPDDPGPSPEAEETCTVGASGIKFCKKKDGRECFEASAGAMICWGVGETGQRSQGDTAQTRAAGSDAPTPTPPTPPETFDPTKTRGPETTTTTITNPDGSTRTITTTIINNTTTNGTNAPGTPGSAPPQSGGDNDGDDDEDSASGGEDCDTPPIVTGDAILGMVATQAWATRCAVEAGNAAAVTGDVGDCKSPFSVEGNNANAEQLRALRAKICNDEGRIEGDEAGMRSYAATLESDIDAMESEFGESAFGEGTGIGSIVSTRFGGGGGCPVISIQTPWGATWQPPPRFCDVIAALRLLFLAVATIWALRIVGGE